MKSPFPGMDPYLEAHWLDVHPRLCNYACDAINAQLGNDLLAHMGERLIVETIFDETRWICPDVHIIEHAEPFGTPVHPSAAAVAEPLLIPVEREPIRQPYIEIIDIRIGRVITIIEFISPTNKLAADGRAKYLKKQTEAFDARVSLVEIDLVRCGKQVALAQVDNKTGRTMYYASVYRGYRWEKLECWPMPIDKPLSAIRIPLRETDPDAILELQPLVDQAYRNGRYDVLLDYRNPCIPPLSGNDAEWATALLQAARKR